VAVETDNGVQTVEGIMQALTTLLAGASWSGAKLHLYKSSFAPGPSNVAADFLAAEANFTGYAPVTLTYSSIGVDANGSPVALTNRAFFQATDAVSPNTIGGCWVENDIGTTPVVKTSVEFYQFQSPIPMSLALQFIGVVVAVYQPGGPGYAVVDH